MATLGTKGSGEVLLKFESQPEITAKELSEFLYCFRTSYGISGEFFFGVDPTNVLESPDEYVKKFEEIVSSFTPGQEQKFYDMDLQKDELFLLRIKRENPLEIVFAGGLALIFISAFISGGKVKARGFGIEINVDMKPIAYGLEKLKKLFKK